MGGGPGERWRGGGQNETEPIRLRCGGGGGGAANVRMHMVVSNFSNTNRRLILIPHRCVNFSFVIFFFLSKCINEKRDRLDKIYLSETLFLSGSALVSKKTIVFNFNLISFT